MTEKEALAKIKHEIIGEYVIKKTINEACGEILALAKAHGAKFDPEPVRLPELTVGEYQKSRIFKDVGVTTRVLVALTPEEAAEAVRRCNAWDTVLHLLRGAQIGKASLTQVIAGMEGREPLDGREP